jgi:GNAT superfamily N-acetyltransferase
MAQNREVRWKLRTADALGRDEADRIGAFISSFGEPGGDSDGRRSHSGAYYSWKLRDNPAGPGFVSLAVDGERIVGTTTVTRKHLYHRGRPMLAAEIGDTFTDPEYQRQGIFTALVKATRDRATAAGIEVIYGTPNPNSLPGYEKNLAFRQKAGLDLRLCVVPLRPATVANTRLAARGVTLPARSIDRLAGVFLRSEAVLLARSCEAAPLAFDDSFDDLDARLRDRHEVCLRRTSADLDYRLRQNPDSDRYTLLTCRPGGRLEGFVVCKRAFQHGLPILWLADCAATSPLVEARLWSAAIRAGVEGGFALLAAWLPRRPVTWLTRAAAPPVPLNPVPVILYDHGLGREILPAEVTMRFSILDSDNV